MLILRDKWADKKGIWTSRKFWMGNRQHRATQEGGTQGDRHPNLTQLPCLPISKPNRKSEGLCGPFKPRAKDREQGEKG